MTGRGQGGLFQRICAIYARQGAAQRCLGLQDRYGFDVSLGLCALAEGQAGRLWSDATLASLRTAGWDERAAVTAALRHARRRAEPLAAVDPAVANLRAAILRQELAAERIAVEWLETRLRQLALAPSTAPAAARTNLRIVAGPDVPQDLLDALADIAEGRLHPA